MPFNNELLVNILRITAQAPQLVGKPRVDEHLQQLDALSRSTECFRYVLLRTEHWISPGGHLREWLRRNVLLCAWLIIPAVFVMPVVGFFLWQLTGWLSMLRHLILPLILGILALRIVRFPSSSWGSSRRRK